MVSHIKLAGGILNVKLSGPASFDEAKDAFQTIFKTAFEKHCRRVLIDLSDLQGNFTGIQRFVIGEECAKQLHGLRFYPRIAVVGRRPVIDGFGVLVGKNRGIDARLLAEEREAVDWLSERISAKNPNPVDLKPPST